MGGSGLGLSGLCLGGLSLSRLGLGLCRLCWCGSGSGSGDCWSGCGLRRGGGGLLIGWVLGGRRSD